MDPQRHAVAIQKFQARLLALRGRGGDDEIAHVTQGELVVPRSLQTSGVVGALRTASSNKGVSLERLRVGSRETAVNPATGLSEFADPLAAPMEEVNVTARRMHFAPRPGDEEMLTRLIFSEGANHFAKHPDAMPAIRWSVVNRVGRTGFKTNQPDLQNIITAPYQFSAVTQKHPDGKPSLWDLSAAPDKLTGPNKNAFAVARETAQNILNGQIEDKTGGVQYFHSAPEHPDFHRDALANKKIEPVRTIGQFKFFRDVKR